MLAGSSSRDRILVVHPERKAQRTLQRLVGATLCPVELVDVEALPRAVDERAIVVIDAPLALARPALRELPARAWIAVPGEGLAPAEATLVAGLLDAGWDHVVAHPMPVLGEEVIATVQKLLRRDTYGLEKYMVWGAEVRSYVLEDALERDSAVAALARDVCSVGLQERVASLVSVIADELIANALYTAPVDEAGHRFRMQESREKARRLGERDIVTLRWATDARYLAVEVRDKWGTADVATIAQRLAAAGTQRASEESGMGLALAYACCTQFVLDLAPGTLTEVIALVDVRHKPTELGRAGSFHAFVEHKGATP